MMLISRCKLIEMTSMRLLICANPDVFNEPGCPFAGIVAVPTLELAIKGPFKPVH